MSPRAWRIVFLLLVFLLLLYVAYLLRGVFIPVFVALIAAYILNPLVTWLEKKKNVPRLASIGGIYALFLIVFLSVIFIAIPAAVRQGVEFVKVTFIGSADRKIRSRNGPHEFTRHGALLRLLRARLPIAGRDAFSLVCSLTGLIGASCQHGGADHRQTCNPTLHLTLPFVLTSMQATQL